MTQSNDTIVRRRFEPSAKLAPQIKTDEQFADNKGRVSGLISMRETLQKNIARDGDTAEVFPIRFFKRKVKSWSFSFRFRCRFRFSRFRADTTFVCPHNRKRRRSPEEKQAWRYLHSRYLEYGMNQTGMNNDGNNSSWFAICVVPRVGFQIRALEIWWWKPRTHSERIHFSFLNSKPDISGHWISARKAEYFFVKLIHDFSAMLRMCSHVGSCHYFYRVEKFIHSYKIFAQFTCYT